MKKKLNPLTIILLSNVIFITLFSILIWQYLKTPITNNTLQNEEKQEQTIYTRDDIKRAISTLDQVNLMAQAEYDLDLNTPNDIKKAMLDMLSVNKELTHDNIITTSIFEFELNNLNPKCIDVPAQENINKQSACVEIIVDVNSTDGPNKLGEDRFSILAYKDKFVTLPNSAEDHILRE